MLYSRSQASAQLLSLATCMHDRTITVLAIRYVNFTVVPETDYKQCGYLLTTVIFMSNSIKDVLSRCVICVVKMLSQVTIFDLQHVT